MSVKSLQRNSECVLCVVVCACVLRTDSLVFVATYYYTFLLRAFLSEGLNCPTAQHYPSTDHQQ
jgi:hypothetical protein